MVGPVPNACTRTLNDNPAVYVTPGTVTADPTVVAPTRPRAPTAPITDPFAFTHTRAPYIGARTHPTRVTVRYNGPPTGTRLALNTATTSASRTRRTHEPLHLLRRLANATTAAPGLTDT